MVGCYNNSYCESKNNLKFGFFSIPFKSTITPLKLDMNILHSYSLKKTASTGMVSIADCAAFRLVYIVLIGLLNIFLTLLTFREKYNFENYTKKIIIIIIKENIFDLFYSFEPLYFTKKLISNINVS